MNVSGPIPAAEGLPGDVCAVNRERHMEEMYEVLKFIEHGTCCRRSLDCVQGVSLMRRMKEHPETDRRKLLAWFREIAVCVEQYHRSGSGQDYRYLNPCSIIVTEEDRMMLLDLEAPDNASVIKQMQTGAVRDHFIRPVCDLGVSRNHEADLFAYGKTVQFLLAYMDIQPSLTQLEEMKMDRIIRRCTGAYGRRYDDFSQVIKVLPQIRGKVSNSSQEKKLNPKRIAGGVGLGAAACLCLCVLLGLEKHSLVEAEEEKIYREAENKGERKAAEIYERRLTALKEQQETERIIREAAERGAEAGKNAAEEVKIRETEKQLLDAYNSLLKYEKDSPQAEEIRKKKTELENRP